MKTPFEKETLQNLFQVIVQGFGGLARAFAVACTHANLGVAQKIKIVVAKKQFKAH